MRENAPFVCCRLGQSCGHSPQVLSTGLDVPATAGDLLEQVQRQAWDLAVALPDHEWTRVREAAGQVRGHVAAWPQLAAAAAYALRSTPLPVEQRRELGPALGVLDRVAKRITTRSTVANEQSPQMARMTTLLGAVGDLMVDEPRAFESTTTADAMAMRDKIAATVESAARTTYAFTEMAPGLTNQTKWPGDLRGLVYELRSVMSTAPGERAGSYDDLAAVVSADPGFSGSVQRWQSVMRGMLTAEGGVTSTTAMRAASEDLSALSQAGAVTMRVGLEVGVLRPREAVVAANALSQAGRAWSEAAGSWTFLRSGGGLSEVQVETSQHLHAALRDMLFDGPTWADPEVIASRVDVPRLAGEMRRVAGMADRLGVEYAKGVGDLVNSEVLVMPARVVVRTVRPVPVELLRPAQRGMWVPVSRDRPEAQVLMRGAEGARQAARVARRAAEATAKTPAAGAGTSGHAAGISQRPASYRAPAADRGRGA
jgi:hypothetical protein